MNRFTKACKFLIPLCCLGGQAVLAQEAGCGSAPGFSQFDFWVGQWEVYNNADDTLAGRNVIEKTEAGCLVEETWSGVGGSSGRSVNYFNPVTGQWRQVWVSAQRYAIDIEGGLRDGAMIMTGTIWYYDGGNEFDFRGTWTPNADDSVRQFFEQFDPESEQWQPWFDGRYVPAEPE